MIDANSICEAVQRPNMRFVAVQTVEQQSILHLHISLQLLVKMRTQVSNHLRGLPGEYGLILPQGICHLTDSPALAEDATTGFPGVLRHLLMDMLEHVREIDRKIDVMDAQIRQWHRHSDASQRLAEIPGIGLLLTATALVGHVGANAQGFDSGRHLAAYLGLLPRQHSSGGKQRLAHVSKRGNAADSRRARWSGCVRESSDTALSESIPGWRTCWRANSKSGCYSAGQPECTHRLGVARR